jgi:hypothetical protein
VSIASAVAFIFAASTAVFLLVFGEPTPQPISEVISQFLLLAVVILGSLFAMYLAARRTRDRAHFFRRLLPAAREYITRRFAEPATVLNNGLIVQHVEGGGRGRSSPDGLRFDAFLNEDRSILTPTEKDLNVWYGDFRFGFNLRRVWRTTDPLFPQLEDLRKRLGSFGAHTQVTKTSNPTVRPTSSPHWYVALRLDTERWFQKGDFVVRLAADILAFMCSLVPPDESA